MNDRQQEDERMKWYKNQLSPFGHQVLRILVEQWNSDCTPKWFPSSTRPRQNFVQQKKVLNFRDSHSYTPILAPPIEQFKDTNQPINNTMAINDEQNLPVSCIKHSSELSRTDLLNIFENNTEKNIETLQEVEKNAEIKEKNAEVKSWPMERESLITHLPFNDITQPETSAKLHDIQWNDFVDSELLQSKLPIQIEAPAVAPDETLIFGQSNKDIPLDVDDCKKNKKKTTKRKNSTLLTEKKVKKLLADPKLQRKDIYTKTVKNWLNDVETKVLNKVDVTSVTLQADDKPKVERKIGIGDINITKNVTKKKVVQTKLANKDGIMKYGKAKSVSVNLNEEVPVGKDDAPVKEIGKDKKTRSKFVAPIKSQIPVKDVIYDVVTVDDTNAQEHLKGLAETRGDVEILAVLIYKNGFNQLNSIYTEETCIPDGILLNINERFFLIKHFDGIVKEFMANICNRSTMLCYDGKMILIYLLQFFEFRPCSMIDLKIAGALLDPDNLPESFSDVQKILAFTPEYTISTECALQKVAWYSVILRECVSKSKALLIEDSMWKIFEEVEMPLVPIIADMERYGISVDVEKLNAMEQVLVERMKAVELECHAAAGRAFQVTSAAQVRALLYDELRLDGAGVGRVAGAVPVRCTAATGAKSTSEAALRRLLPFHSLPRLVLQHRHLHKAHATFVAGVASRVRAGVVRPSWEQIAAATGRVAASNPNLQAIPKKPFSLDMFADSENDDEALHFRSVFVAREGHVLLAADFRHVECRVWAAAAADAAMLTALHHHDMFRALAADWLGKREEAVTAAERERTKRLVYASLYGCGAAKLADILAVSYQQALDVLTTFNRKFPSLRSFGQRVVGACAGAGGGRLRTSGGRSRRFPALAADAADADHPASERARATRQAVNYVVQGSAADLCKVAMALAGGRLAARAGAATLLLQLHDELVWEVRREHLDWAAGVVKEAMEASGARCGLALRLPVAAAAGPSWAALAPI